MLVAMYEQVSLRLSLCLKLCDHAACTSTQVGALMSCRRAVERLHEERDEARAAVESLQAQVEEERQQGAVAVEEVCMYESMIVCQFVCAGF